MSPVPIYTPGWRETVWSKVSCLRKQHDRKRPGSNQWPSGWKSDAWVQFLLSVIFFFFFWKIEYFFNLTYTHSFCFFTLKLQTLWGGKFASMEHFIITLFVFSYQQWRLIPKLAAAYALAYFARIFFLNFVELQVGMMMGETGEAQVSYE